MGGLLIGANLLLYVALFLELAANKERTFAGMLHDTLCAGAMLIPAWVVVTALGAEVVR